jgi:hypothetical protein
MPTSSTTALLLLPRCSSAATFGSLLAALPLIVRFDSQLVRPAARRVARVGGTENMRTTATDAGPIVRSASPVPLYSQVAKPRQSLGTPADVSPAVPSSISVWPTCDCN